MLGSLPKPLRQEQLESALQHYSQCLKGNVLQSGPRQPLPISTQDLCHAIDCEHIDEHYQPKVDIRTGLVRGMEVLARWTHPSLDRIPPDQLIALAEKEGLIFDLTLRVLRKSIRQAAAWVHMGFTPKLAINLSPLLLDNPGIVQEITSLLESSAISPSQAVLEITESAGVEQLGKVIAGLTRLRLKGFGLSIDDYGTGFSSMQQLALRPFSELKIDSNLVHGAHQRRNLRGDSGVGAGHGQAPGAGLHGRRHRGHGRLAPAATLRLCRRPGLPDCPAHARAGHPGLAAQPPRPPARIAPAALARPGAGPHAPGLSTHAPRRWPHATRPRRELAHNVGRTCGCRFFHASQATCRAACSH
ncbi:EAL domain-containing protein [Comamonas aquatica]|uniref:EAL domain-containing protein n=1 Tax=Comamonas aquatica TaxID=225991 RepID=UPI003F6862F5